MDTIRRFLRAVPDAKLDEGNVSKVFEWFGYKLHLLVDVKHEVAVAYEITSTKAGDGETLPEVLAEARANLPQGRIRTLKSCSVSPRY